MSNRGNICLEKVESLVREKAYADTYFIRTDFFRPLCVFAKLYLDLCYMQAGR